MFGGVLRASGIGQALAGSLETIGMPLIVAAFLISTALRVAQGSATVALTTTAGLLAPTVAATTGLSPFDLCFLVIAIACGATVLASDTAPVREVITAGEGGLLAEFFDVDRFVAQANEVLDDPAAFRHLGVAGAAMVRERYSLDVCLPRMLALYEEVTGRVRGLFLDGKLIYNVPLRRFNFSAGVGLTYTRNELDEFRAAVAKLDLPGRTHNGMAANFGVSVDAPLWKRLQLRVGADYTDSFKSRDTDKHWRGNGYLIWGFGGR